MPPPRVRAHEARVLRQRGMADDVAESSEQVVVSRAHDDRVAVAGREGLERRDVRVPRAESPGERAGHEVRRERVLEDGELTIEHRDVDHRTGAALASFVERARDAGREEEAGGDVADRHADARGRAVGMAREAHEAAHRLRNQVEGGSLAHRARVPEPRRNGVDERRPARVQRRPPVAEALEHARPEVLDQHVGPREQRLERRPVGVALQVERDRLFPVVERREVERLPADERADRACVVARRRALDLDHARPQVREQQRAERAGQHARQVDDGDAGERTRIGRGRHRAARYTRRRRTRETALTTTQRVRP